MKKIILILVMFLAAGCEEPLTSDEQLLAMSDDDIKAEIQAVGELSDPGFKKERLLELARRKDLGESAQVFLVRIAGSTLADENDQKDVLIALIRNKKFTCAARDAILKRLDQFQNDQVRQALAERLKKKQTCIES